MPETRYERHEHSVSDDEANSHTQEKAANTKSVRRPSEDSIEQVPRKAYMQELSLWSGRSDTNLIKMFFRYILRSLNRCDISLTNSSPFPMIVYPAVIYSFLCYSISLVIVVAVNILNPFVLQAPPFSWAPQINGLINIPGLLGNVFGAWAGGECLENDNDMQA